ncbi:SOS response-associated peptidase [Paenibacillus sp. NEAU-GSW1]|uniref:SOS response-associated peptidase n=1 Tax=Paenibacillus sp. NEAU-GSW1 TaxID=2682486 RepID=UPI0012E2F3FB|nr:SOS response-associated peptidase [Paenibacillus sp. NEAU-GSW1]MUT66841.1 SOS response-associated peptidase [Paenibacillus sp. NEAU-GSW1]
MCGRYTITVSLEELMLRYMIGAVSVPYHRPKYNVAPGQMVLAVVNDGEQNRLGELKWGLIPPWADSPKVGNMMLNARAETAAAKPAFLTPLRRKRCLIPADGFYEWKKEAGGKTKQPMRIVRKDRSIFSMAGLYETWKAADGTTINSCTIMTTAPNSLMAPIHDRMPVILRPEDEPFWLDRSVQEPSALERLLRPYASEELEAYPVTSSVGSVRYDEPDCIEPITLTATDPDENEQLGLW